MKFWSTYIRRKQFGQSILGYIHRTYLAFCGFLKVITNCTLSVLFCA